MHTDTDKRTHTYSSSVRQRCVDVDLLYLTLMCEWGHLLGLTDTEMVGPSLSGISFVHFRMFFTQDWDDQIIQGIGVGLKKKKITCLGTRKLLGLLSLLLPTSYETLGFIKIYINCF